jgi:hypothetical protein
MEMNYQIYASTAFSQGEKPPAPVARKHEPKSWPNQVSSSDKYLAVIEKRSIGSRTCSLVTNID